MNSSRTRAVVLAFAALALAACSNVHPGSAAVVDGQSISMDKADRASAAYCKLSLAVASQQGVTSVSAADARRQSISDLITYVVARKLIKERGLPIDPNSYVLTDSQKAQIAKAFPRGDKGQIRAAIERSQETYSIIVALGEASTGKTMADDSNSAIEKAGQAEITKAYKTSDISIDPRFGLNDVTKKIADTGSLSIAEVTEADIDPAELPTSQHCS